jgi:hypothetical protein
MQPLPQAHACTEAGVDSTPTPGIADQPANVKIPAILLAVHDVSLVRASFRRSFWSSPPSLLDETHEPQWAKN